MEFTVVVENTLNGIQLEFDSPFGVDDCFEESDFMLFLVCKYLKIEKEQYNSVGEVIDEFSDELEDCIKVIEIKDFPITCQGSTISDVNDFYNLEDEKKVSAFLEYQGGYNLSDLLSVDFDDILLLEGVQTKYQLGQYMVYDVHGSLEELPRDILESHFDYESYGEVCSYDGGFTDHGFIIVQKRGDKK